MSNYTLQYDVAYEGKHDVPLDSLEDVVAWVKNHRSTYDYSYDNLTLHGPVGEMDLYGLMERAEEGCPLIDPDYARAEAAVLRVLSAFRYGSVTAHTMAELDSLRDLVARKMAEAEASGPSGPR